jgi:DNA-binding NtrC family response regulator
MRKKISTLSKNIKILIVDDEQGIIDSLSIMLERSGYYYEGTTNPLKAIEKVRNEHFDLMILDYLMVPIHGVFCKYFFPKVAKYFSIVLQQEFPQCCKPCFAKLLVHCRQ